MAEGSRIGNNPTGSIDFRGHVTDAPRPAEVSSLFMNIASTSTTEKQYQPLYSRGQKVYLKRPRSTEGPYVIDAVYADGTYRLTENGQVIMDGVKEGALKLAV